MSLAFESSLSAFSLVPYKNCIFQCKYCYLADIFGESFGRDIEPNLKLSEEIRKRKYSLQTESWILSAHTDPYPPIEKKYEVTKNALLELKIIMPKFGIIITKSPLVLRDIDIIKDFGDNVMVGFSIGSDRQDIIDTFENGAPAVQKRFEAAKKLKESGVKVRILVSPLMLHTDDFVHKIKEVADSVYLEIDPEETWADFGVPADRANFDYNTKEFVEKLRMVFQDDKLIIGRKSLASGGVAR